MPLIPFRFLEVGEIKGVTPWAECRLVVFTDSFILWARSLSDPISGGGLI